MLLDKIKNQVLIQCYFNDLGRWLKRRAVAASVVPVAAEIPLTFNPIFMPSYINRPLWV